MAETEVTGTLNLDDVHRRVRDAMEWLDRDTFEDIAFELIGEIERLRAQPTYRKAIADLRDAPPELCQLLVDHQRTAAGRSCRCGWSMGPEGNRHGVHLADVLADFLESRLTKEQP